MDALLRPAASTTVARVGAELAVLRGDTGDVLVLNTSASEIWDLCDGTRSEDDLIRELQRRHPEATGLAIDVHAAVRRFAERGFVERTP